MECKFAYLSYASSVFSEATSDLALFWVKLGPGGSKPVETCLYVHPEWQKLASSEDWDYISEVFDDLHSVDLEQATEVLEQFSSLSMGPLRTGKTGVCSDTDIADLILGVSFAQAS